MADAVVKVNKRGEVTIPASLVKKMGARNGGFVFLDLNGDKSLTVKKAPKIVPGEERYYTKGWIEAERQATEEYQRGGLPVYNSVDEMMDELRRTLGEPGAAERAAGLALQLMA